MSEPDPAERTRRSYDAAAEDYAAWIGAELAAKPLDRALLGGFAELVRSAKTGPVADIGCGTGRISAHLAGLGLPVFGIDLAPRMVALARRAHPELRFEVGTMTDLALDDAGLAGIVAWYSTIHVPDEQLPRAFAEFARTLAPGGYLQLGFQAGEGVVHYESFGEHAVALDFHRRHPEDVVAMLRRAGLQPCARTVREADVGGDFPERTPQAFVLARKPG
ncbi:class I SAM-dependent methyltransferase [Saccharopolyspora sp. HNM0983]|uniref:Class I SAM-dependent methyltransferase n=1 Tax=Saccharopolyspora montiporae TaxID=2781240 RepID=A0A929B876_9PSEU|nr:class I SAM-dependent methyltransferase [Saccharopolyspora sp. HNM0983]